ncbi:hypothetical protein SELMODRAFT_430261 [Selaginella moellendorffii]|uniref:KANL3/Tex30 alpha/beta hydrolase-like domain-containing protein n=1 Tax=Selaginella moellendorffii TaxID=88036 RepID=D8T8V4_SELML|nr:KAT8 regulatory NSL complex subunit 3 [Selaginella moellendorffii]EFJ06893.1 hypothetical protein SELMODRAFT_430261 [Selaginella moellendorffii]|eukprot:XP_002992044.1 KAT8 regulatory NSL complex subunit 3 [Selaginella moellendorffii]
MEEREAKRPRLNPAPLLVFAHGAGAPSSSDWMIRWKNLLATATNAVDVITFDYPYLSGGKKGAPPKAEKLVDFHLQQVNKGVEKYPGHPVVLVGKSMGSRVGCMVAAKAGSHQIAAVICLGYPLKGSKGSLRDQTLLEVPVPTMFVQGTKDTMCPLDKLHSVVTKMPVKTSLHTIEGGDHSFKVPKKVLDKNSTTQESLELHAVNAIQLFLADSLCMQ